MKGFGDGGVEIGMVLRFSCSSACSVCTALCAYLTVNVSTLLESVFLESAQRHREPFTGICRYTWLTIT